MVDLIGTYFSQFTGMGTGMKQILHARVFDDYLETKEESRKLICILNEKSGNFTSIQIAILRKI